MPVYSAAKTYPISGPVYALYKAGRTDWFQHTGSEVRQLCGQFSGHVCTRVPNDEVKLDKHPLATCPIRWAAQTTGHRESKRVDK